MLKLTRSYDIIRFVKGETGVIPVRARRREVHFMFLFYPMPQIGDKPLEFSEKVNSNAPSRNTR